LQVVQAHQPGFRADLQIVAGKDLGDVTCDALDIITAHDQAITDHADLLVTFRLKNRKLQDSRSEVNGGQTEGRGIEAGATICHHLDACDCQRRNRNESGQEQQPQAAGIRK